MTAVTIPNPPTPEWLTTVLRQSGTLPTGYVTRVEESANAAFNSAARHLRLTYSPDAPPDMPVQLFFKRNLPEARAIRAGAREVAFYQVAATMADHLPMLATCYGSAYDNESGDSWLLFRDVSATHAPPVTREQLIAGRGVPPGGNTRRWEQADCSSATGIVTRLASRSHCASLPTIGAHFSE